MLLKVYLSYFGLYWLILAKMAALDTSIWLEYIQYIKHQYNCVFSRYNVCVCFSFFEQLISKNIDFYLIFTRYSRARFLEYQNYETSEAYWTLESVLMA